MLTSTALVLFMTIPGLALFYGGMVRSKNILSVMMQCFAITGLITILWFVYGYSMAFDTTGMEAGVVNFNSFVGGLSKLFLSGVTPASITGPAALFPEAVFVTYQMTFAIITPALIVGCFRRAYEILRDADLHGRLVHPWSTRRLPTWCGAVRVRCWVTGACWTSPAVTVVHINAGVAGLVACLVLGKRKGFPTTPMAPHNLGYTLVGAAMAVGRLVRLQRRFRCRGQRHCRYGDAGDPGRLPPGCRPDRWMFAEWLTHGKPRAMGIASGVVVGAIVAITPDAGTVGPMGALIIGLAAGEGVLLLSQ